VKHYLLVFDPVPGDLIAEVEFDDPAAALKARFRVEREGSWDGRRLGGDVEVVVFDADSAETLRWTHARYFMSAAQMAREAALSLGSPPPA
jgi:hypothetical protein